MNVDLPLLDHHLLDDRADETLPFCKRQRGQRGGDGAGEVRHTPLKVGPLESRRVLTADYLEAGLHVGTPLAEQALPVIELPEFDQPGLVGIEEPMLLAIHLGQLPLEVLDLLSDGAVGLGRRFRSQPSVRLDDQGWALEMPTHLLPHEPIEFIGANVALGTASNAAAGAEEIVSGAVVVMVEGAIPASHPVARDCEVTHAAAHDAPQQVVARLQVARTEASTLARS